jgi:hypothetical protein
MIYPPRNDIIGFMAPKSSSDVPADGRTPAQKFDDLAHQLFPPVKPSGKQTKPAKAQQKKARH